MIRINHKRAQAATELAVFGAILIFLLGAIIRSSAGNSYTQNQNLKTMRMAMLNSWNGSKAGTTSRNSASVLFVEDRLSPDIGKYGDLDRNPYIANGSGSFTYMMMYPLTDTSDVLANLPIMDVYVNGQHFPFTTASFVANRQITPFTSCTSDCSAQTPQQQQCVQNQSLRNQREWVQGPNNTKYKLFYTIVANEGGGASASSSGFSTTPPACPDTNTVVCKDKALSSTLTLPDASGNPYTNTNGAMQYDLLRNGDYAAVNNQFPVGGDMRKYIAWQWAATAATSEKSIGLDAANGQYSSYDIDGRLKEVTIYKISPNPDGSPTVSYEDPAGGDIDGAWDTNSCGPKPGLQSESQIYTFTKDGTFLQIKEGQLYNPETGQVVRSTGMRNTIDLVQRKIQLSNNTGRFCPLNSIKDSTNGQSCINGTGGVNEPSCVDNPVEACGNCFDGDNLKKTCFDPGNNMIYVRSRLEDRRGNSWMTNASGQLKVQ